MTFVDAMSWIDCYVELAREYEEMVTFQTDIPGQDSCGFCGCAKHETDDGFCRSCGRKA